jgi:DNA-binding NtrC family response regulator
MHEPMKVLIVDDEPAMREVLQVRLAQWGYDPVTAACAEEARERCAALAPDAVLCDVVLPGGSGLDLLPDLRGAERRPVVMITAHGAIDTAVEAVKRGAKDFLTKPLDYSKLKAVLEEAASELRLRGGVRRLEERLGSAGRLGGLVGQSKGMKAVYDLVRVVARTDAPALITGESGTGKELVARAIHDLSGRAASPFVAVNAAAIPEGLMESELFGHEKGAFTGAVTCRPGCFEMADRGTLFLDEIAEMPAPLQPKFLRTLENGKVRRLGGREEKEFDVRLLAATNRDPEAAIASGHLRQDLYYRLNVFTVAMPSLRERVEDLPLLVQHFVGLFDKKHGASVEGARAEVLSLMEAYPWPGNVRELRNVVERAVILAREGWIEAHHLPPYLRRPSPSPVRGLVIPSGATLAEAEKRLILAALEETGNNKAEAARRLGLDVKTIRNKLKSYGMEGDG